MTVGGWESIYYQTQYRILSVSMVNTLSVHRRVGYWLLDLIDLVVIYSTVYWVHTRMSRLGRLERLAKLVRLFIDPFPI